MLIAHIGCSFCLVFVMQQAVRESEAACSFPKKGLTENISSGSAAILQYVFPGVDSL